jgi:hypothetical protein
MMPTTVVIFRGSTIMHTSSRNRSFIRVFALALIVSAFALAGVAGPAVAHPRVFTDDCGYSGCHGGAPIPGTETSAAVETTCVPGTPAVSGKVKVRKAAKITGSLSPAPSVATTITVYYERQSGKKWIKWSHANLIVATGATKYVAKPKFPKRGNWRVSAQHLEASGEKSTSKWRGFKVR